MWTLTLFRAIRSHKHGQNMNVICKDNILILTNNRLILWFFPDLSASDTTESELTYISPLPSFPSLFVLSKNFIGSITNWKGQTLLVQFNAFSQSEHACVTNQATTIPALQKPLPVPFQLLPPSKAATVLTSNTMDSFCLLLNFMKYNHMLFYVL